MRITPQVGINMGLAASAKFRRSCELPISAVDYIVERALCASLTLTNIATTEGHADDVVSRPARHGAHDQPAVRLRASGLSGRRQDRAGTGQLRDPGPSCSHPCGVAAERGWEAERDAVCAPGCLGYVGVLPTIRRGTASNPCGEPVAQRALPGGATTRVDLATPPERLVSMASPPLAPTARPLLRAVRDGAGDALPASCDD